MSMSLFKSSKTAIDPSQFLKLLKEVLIRVTIDCLSCHQSSDNGRFFYRVSASSTKQKVFIRLIFNTRTSFRRIFFFCNNCSSLQSAIIEHGFSRVRQFSIIQLKQFVNFQGTVVTKDINIVKCFPNISIPVILDDDLFEQKKFTFISAVNHSENYTAIIWNGHYNSHVTNNFSLACYNCNDAAVVSCCKEVLEYNASYILFYKAA